MLVSGWRRLQQRPKRRSIHLAQLMLVAICTGATAATAGDLSTILPPARNLSLQDLEERVWGIEDHELHLLEREIVRHIQTHPRSAHAHQLLSQTLLRMFAKDPSEIGLLIQAGQLAQQAVDLNPRAEFGHLAMAHVWDLRGNPSQGLAILEEYERSGSEPSWRVYFAKARLLSESQPLAKVLGLMKTALSFTDANAPVIVPYVIALLQTEAEGAALISELEKWNAQFPSNLFDLTLAITKSKMGEAQAAHEMYQKIIKSTDDNLEARVNDAILLYRDLQRPQESIQKLSAILKEKDPHRSEQVVQMVRSHLATAHLQVGQYSEAKRLYKNAIARAPENQLILDFVARQYRSREAFAQLADLLKELIMAAPGKGIIHALLGETLSEKLGDHRGAVLAFSDAIVLSPERSDFYNGLGLALYRLKRFKVALEFFEKASEVDPADATAIYNEACMLALLGRGEEALLVLKQALALDPRLIKSAQRDGDFASIRETPEFTAMVSENLDDDIAH